MNLKFRLNRFSEKIIIIISFCYSRYNFGNDSLHAGVLSYGSDVHTGNDESIFLDESAAQSRQAFNAKVATLSFVNGNSTFHFLIYIEVFDILFLCWDFVV